MNHAKRKSSWENSICHNRKNLFFFPEMFRVTCLSIIFLSVLLLFHRFGLNYTSLDLPSHGRHRHNIPRWKTVYTFSSFYCFFLCIFLSEHNILHRTTYDYTMVETNLYIFLRRFILFYIFVQFSSTDTIQLNIPKLQWKTNAKIYLLEYEELEKVFLY